MINCRIFLIDTPADINLIKESLSYISKELDFRGFASVPEALQAIKDKTPDLIMIGSGVIMTSGFKLFFQIGPVPTVILCEGNGFDFLLKEEKNNILFLSRSFDFEGIPKMLMSAFQFMQSCREGGQCTPRK